MQRLDSARAGVRLEYLLHAAIQLERRFGGLTHELA
jgi:hypothetical protein